MFLGNGLLKIKLLGLKKLRSVEAEQILDVRAELNTLDVLDGELPGIPSAAALVSSNPDHMVVEGVCLSYHAMSALVALCIFSIMIGTMAAVSVIFCSRSKRV